LSVVVLRMNVFSAVLLPFLTPIWNSDTSPFLSTQSFSLWPNAPVLTIMRFLYNWLSFLYPPSPCISCIAYSSSNLFGHLIFHIFCSLFSLIFCSYFPPYLILSKIPWDNHLFVLLAHCLLF
jgi:hypothetical protein